MTFQRLESVVSFFRWNLLSWAQSIELIPISGHQHQSQSYVTTDGQSASLSWCQACTWDLRRDFLSLSCGFLDVGPEAYLGYGRQGTCHGRHWQEAFGSFVYQHFRIDTFLLILTYVYISVY
jgi:hypothetical protein